MNSSIHAELIKKMLNVEKNFNIERGEEERFELIRNRLKLNVIHQEYLFTIFHLGMWSEGNPSNLNNTDSIIAAIQEGVNFQKTTSDVVFFSDDLVLAYSQLYVRYVMDVANQVLTQKTLCCIKIYQVN